MTHTDNGADNEAPQLPGIRARLLEGLLRNAPFDGWSQIALDAAARDTGVTPELAAIAFPGGLAQAAEALHDQIDVQMLEKLAGVDLAALKIRERVTFAVRTRLEVAAPHREAFRALATYLANPLNAPLAGKLMWRTVDALWRAIGDSSTDFAFYSKRATLAAVWGATVMIWLQDQSEDFAETWAFLDRRIENVMAIEACKGRLRQTFGQIPDPFGLFRRKPAARPPHSGP
jgi:ubiquinone biosynthesis protein COQ9